jgi:hypothetical protein
LILYEADITLKYSLDNHPPENIRVYTETDEGFYIVDGHQKVNFDLSEEVVEYLIERIGRVYPNKCVNDIFKN